MSNETIIQFAAHRDRGDASRGTCARGDLVTVRRLATIIVRDIGAPGRPSVIKPFYLDETGGSWAVPRDHEYRALRNRGDVVEIEIHCFDDQFAYPVS